ncbi:MAG: hypothetical protein ABIQ11_09140 [Saprospiraceae bacterium]
MKSTPIALISTFRKNISFQTLLFLLLVTAMILFCIAFYSRLDQYQHALRMVIVLMFIVGYIIYQRKRTLFSILNPADPSATESAFESYLNSKREKFRSSSAIRIIMGVIFLIGTILMLIYNPGSSLTISISFAFIIIIIGSMIVNWILMVESMMLQDLKHCQRNHHSEIS